uniref:Rho GTPase activating protein 30 n=1 Tax=Strix occidentalis caurina TaxID=311401 RepID=A0A8D0EWX8_STROC
MSKDIEATGFNGTAAFMEVRVQSIVVEFILTHVEQLFGDAPLRGTACESPRRSLLLGGGGPGDGQPPPYHVPAALSQGDGPPPIRPYHTIIELSDHRRKGSLKAKKWRSIFHLGRSSHEAKRKLAKAEEKDDKCGKITLRPAKSMDSLSSVPFAGDGKRERPGDPSLSPSCPELDESLEEKLRGQEEPRAPESEGESSTKSEPTTPKAGRASLVAPGRSPKAARSRAEKCAGVHISGPFSVTVPFHITSNLSRLTRGLPCPALAQAATGMDPPTSPPPPTRRSAGDPEHRTGERRPPGPAGVGPPGCRGGDTGLSPPLRPSAGEGKADAEQNRLSLELWDSFAFLDSQETWLEGGGDGDPAVWSPLPDTGPGDSEGFPAIEEGMESGFMNVSCHRHPLLWDRGGRAGGSPLLSLGRVGTEGTGMGTGMRWEWGQGWDGMGTGMGLGTHTEGPRWHRCLQPQHRVSGPCPARCPRGVGGLQHGRHPPACPRPQPGEPPAEQPGSYLSIEECMEEEMFFMAPSGSDAEDRAGDTDSDDMFLSAHDELSPLAAALEPLEQAPGEASAPQSPARPGAAAPQDRSPSPYPAEEGAAGEGQRPGDPVGVLAEGGARGAGQPPGEGAGGEGATGGSSSPGRTDSSTEAGAEAEGAGDRAGAEPVPDTLDREVEEDGAGSGPPTPEEPGEGEPHPPPGSPPAPAPEEAPQEPAEPPVPGSVPEVVPEALPPSAASAEGTGATPGSSPGSPSLSASAPELHKPLPEAPELSEAEPPGEPGCPEPAAVLRRDGSAPARLAARTVRVQQARSVPVVPPKPQFARIPPALQPRAPPATEGDAAVPPRHLPSPTVPEGPPGDGGAVARRAGWREGGSVSFDEAVAAAAEQPLTQAPVRRIQTYGGGELAPTAPPKALPFQKAPLRPRLLRPLSCVAAPEGEAPGRNRLSLTRPAAQAEGAALAPPRRPVGTEGAAGER